MASPAENEAVVRADVACLSLGRELRRWRDWAAEKEGTGEAIETADALLAWLDRIGKEQSQ